MNTLKQALLNEYGSFADRRMKRLETGDTFIADDRKKGDEDARGNLFPSFCTVFVRVVASDRVELRFGGGVPSGPPVSRWLGTQGMTWDGTHARTVSIGPGNVGLLRSLAAAFREIVRPGAPRYSSPAYKYVCPRTATSLERLANALDRAWAHSGAGSSR